MNNPIQQISVGFETLASASKSATRCANCGAEARIDKGTCLNCLLVEGLGAEGESSSEAFENVLGEIDLPDKGWRLGNYEILEEIGRGGMGVIYRARQRHSRRIVAVKRMLSYDAESHETLARFRREAETAASLDHPNILPIYEVSESDEGVPFFSMKLAAGGSLRNAAATLSGKPRECVQLMAKVARALEYAHQRGILHRDLQPGNILLDGRGEPQISDFGLAKWLEGNSDLTRTLTTFGTPGYIAPEQAVDAATDLTPAADIYGLGAILFNLLAGRPPFIGANALSVIRQAGVTEAPRLRSLKPSLNRDLETIAGHCLERDPKARYQSAADLADDLEHWLAGRPVRARRVLVPARIWRWSRRNPMLASAATACLCLVVVVAGLLLREHPVETPNASTGEKSIAVLPFENLAGDQESGVFTDGMQDDILTGLSKVADLKVISRSSVRDFKPGTPRDLREIGRALGARYILEGSARRANGRVRINAHLTEAMTGAQLWAEQYERELADVFVIQGEIARQIARELQAQLSDKERALIATRPTRDMVAYDLYLQARELWSTGLSEDAGRPFAKIELLEQAIARDPAFVPALCMAARAHLELYRFNTDHTPSRLALAKQTLGQAARLQPEAGEVHLSRGLLYYWGYQNYAAAIKELELARQELPNDTDPLLFLGAVQRRQGNWEASTRHLEQGFDLDPLNNAISGPLIANYVALRRYSDAARACETVLSRKPRFNYFPVALNRANIELASRGDLRALREVLSGDAALTALPEELGTGRMALALAERDFSSARLALAIFPRTEWTRERFVRLKDWYVGLIAEKLGAPAEAAEAWTRAKEQITALIAKRPDDAGAFILLGEIDARLGQKEEALRAGEHARELLPVELDAFDGPKVLSRLAGIYAQVDDKAHALDLLASTVKLPNGPSYGQLALDEMWDPLRSEPRFAEILRSLAATN
ncbi:MAG: eukaryotic-like serine/threonine-protein kinase [Verrucomicrobiota bacterium]